MYQLLCGSTSFSCQSVLRARSLSPQIIPIICTKTFHMPSVWHVCSSWKSSWASWYRLCVLGKKPFFP